MRLPDLIAITLLVAAWPLVASCSGGGADAKARAAGGQGPAEAPAPPAAIDAGTAEVLLAKLAELKDRTCACQDLGCVERVELDGMTWMMEQGDSFEDLTPTQAQDERANRIDAEMEACKKRLQDAAVE